ncbi:hypothetical protein [Achromobacter sp. ACRQX]|uniref:hypothetical protein n=1 Tax=Achromobacter sp. ACRQX TaxID=2918181 RepID=UPI001EF2A6B1|nr:hypothetical protein [Achromobacter sp. ACRQX]MCG7326859.1 hypothetical protein [Achromobacter sp. ACRQX]
MKKLLSFLGRLIFKPERTPDPRPMVLEIAHSLRTAPELWKEQGLALVRGVGPLVILHHVLTVDGKLIDLTVDEYRELIAPRTHWRVTSRMRNSSLSRLRHDEWHRTQSRLPRLRGAKR